MHLIAGALPDWYSLKSSNTPAQQEFWRKQPTTDKKSACQSWYWMFTFLHPFAADCNTPFSS